MVTWASVYVTLIITVVLILNMDIERLIECVRKHVFLYDITHNDYKNVNLKNAAWEVIGQELQQSDDAVRTKWKTLRDGYKKYRKAVESSIGSNKRLSQYLWSTQLSFLDDYNTPRYVKATESPPRNQTPTHDAENSQEFILPQNSQTPVLARLSSDRPSRSTKRNNRGDVEDIFNYINKKRKMEYDGIDHLFLSYSDTFKKFPPREQAILKLELAKLFSTTELRLLQSDDSQYASTPSTFSSDWMDNNYEGLKTEAYADVKTEDSDPSEES